MKLIKTVFPAYVEPFVTVDRRLLRFQHKVMAGVISDTEQSLELCGVYEYIPYIHLVDNDS